MIIKSSSDHKSQILKITKESNQFDEDGLAYVEHTFDEYLENPSQSLWYTAFDDEPIGVAYCAPEPVTSGTWNLYMLWLKPGYEGKGFGSKLVAAIESELKQREARLLIVETSGTDDFSGARKFYEKIGFTLEGRIKNFFDAGDDKLIYTKML